MTRYELLERIRVGGMAEIFRGKAVGTSGFERPVAIKRLLPHLSQDKRFVELLMAEAKVLSLLKQRNIVQIFDVGIGDDGKYFLAMEPVDGKDLGTVQRAFQAHRLRMPFDLALHIGAEICEALEYVHLTKAPDGKPMMLVHRDVSPSNVLLSRAGEIKLIDFGIARRVGQAPTGHGAVGDKFAYSSPEQARNEQITPRSDVFSVAILLWELITNRWLFSGLGDIEALRAVRQAQVPRPLDVDPRLSPEIDELLMSALDGDPKRRPTAGELGAKLRSLRYSLDVTVGDPETQLARIVDTTDEVQRESDRMNSLDATVGDRSTRPMLHSTTVVDVGGTPIDRYVLTEHLSEGGMSQIFAGKRLGAGGFEMEVVLKQLLPEFIRQADILDLFIREAKLLGTLDHANIIHTIDFVSYSGEFFIVMEHLSGGDLRTLLKKAKRRGKRFSPAAAIRICREVLSALAYAHAKRDSDGQELKLVHRAVSPSNILVSYAGEVKLTDFGTAFGTAKEVTYDSLFDRVKGKIGYMSPEQAKSEALDHRSDLYSLAVCLYEALTGEQLFVHAGLTTSADEIYSQSVPQVSRKVPGLTPDLDAIMAKALALSPDKRYRTAGEFQDALTRCAYRNGLLMSALELAEELCAACGEFEQWHSKEEDDDPGVMRRVGTEV